MLTWIGGGISQVLQPVQSIYPPLSILELSLAFAWTTTGASQSLGSHKAWHPCARPFLPPPPTRSPTDAFTCTLSCVFYPSHTSTQVRDSLYLSPRNSRHNM